MEMGKRTTFSIWPGVIESVAVDRLTTTRSLLTADSVSERFSTSRARSRSAATSGVETMYISSNWSMMEDLKSWQAAGESIST